MFNYFVNLWKLTGSMIKSFPFEGTLSLKSLVIGDFHMF